ncbi:hypothetical protein DFA_08031 [Cavenderia fasciculata]|uniref:Uncharacterized protein n=1 Tax=Cavenderia fasciculata TaxID=261658 RepID=F4Q4P1_CACFS|nr:uncharacterized protein DFA_08031 [Cavenderia fasciculata]EGG17050.1 hypothetical protein DFA_08031 [Cavenderia fasciculata]|eukprot:XP_004355534.1 hypothetical protein DFA_08031 [Cavenderia fasciculata]
MTTYIDSLSIDKCKELISVGLESIQSRTYIKIYGIIPNDQRIESIYDNAIGRITNVYQYLESIQSIVHIQDIRELANLAEKNHKLCRILAQREVVMTLLQIIIRAEELWKHNYYTRLPLTEQNVNQLYTTLDNESLMLDCIDLLNSILPWVNVSDIPYERFYKVICIHSTSPTSYRLACAVLRTMTLNRETIQPFISVGMINIVRFFLVYQVKSEYSQLQEYWLQITNIIFKDNDRRYYFKSLSDQSLIEEYYEKGRFKLWIPQAKGLRITSFRVMSEIILDGIGYYQGWINTTALFMGHVYIDSPFSDMIYRRLDSTVTRYLASSFYASSLLLYFTVFLSRKEFIYLSVSTVLAMSINMYQERLVNHQKLSGFIYKAFAKYYQTPPHLDSSINNNDQRKMINNRSDILDYPFQ